MANIAPNNDLQTKLPTKQILKIALPILPALLTHQLNVVANIISQSRLGETAPGAGVNCSSLDI